MQKNITQLGPKEAEFISGLAGKNAGIVSLREAVEYWKSKKLAYDILQRLERKGWLARLEPGKYIIIPLEAGPERQWSEDTSLIATTLVKPSAIGYWSAIRHWNWTEQIPRIVYVQTTSRKNRRQQTVFGVSYEFVTVNARKFFGNAKEWRSGKQILITDKEKTLLDCADDVERAGGIEELSKAVKFGSREISWTKLSEYARRFPNRSTLKRLGFLLERQKTPLPVEATKLIQVWQSELSAGIVPLQPGAKKTGKIVTRWRLQLNVEVE
jgi:predicted transcriptional regulator of viral defense system